MIDHLSANDHSTSQDLNSLRYSAMDIVKAVSRIFDDEFLTADDAATFLRCASSINDFSNSIALTLLTTDKKKNVAPDPFDPDCPF